MNDRIPYATAWALCSVALLSLGFLAVVALGVVIATRADPARTPQTLLAFGVYAKVVLAKGLLPALFAALGLWTWFDRGGRLARRGWKWRALGLLAAATLGSVAAAALLLPLSIPGLPPVRFTGTANFVRTCVEMALPVAFAAWLPEVILPRVRRRVPLLLAGLLVVFLAGGASVARLVREASPPPPPAAAPSAPEAAPAAPAELPDSELPLPRLAAAVATDPARLFPNDDPAPVLADGVLTGIELRKVRRGGLYARLGLRDGDRVGAINGVALGSPEVGGELLRAIVEPHEIELSVEHSDGTPAVIAVARDALLAELGVRE